MLSVPKPKMGLASLNHKQKFCCSHLEVPYPMIMLGWRSFQLRSLHATWVLLSICRFSACSFLLITRISVSHGNFSSSSGKHVPNCCLSFQGGCRLVCEKTKTGSTPSVFGGWRALAGTNTPVVSHTQTHMGPSFIQRFSSCPETFCHGFLDGNFLCSLPSNDGMSWPMGGGGNTKVGGAQLSPSVPRRQCQTVVYFSYVSCLEHSTAFPDYKENPDKITYSLIFGFRLHSLPASFSPVGGGAT